MGCALKLDPSQQAMICDVMARHLGLSDKRRRNLAQQLEAAAAQDDPRPFFYELRYVMSRIDSVKIDAGVWSATLEIYAALAEQMHDPKEQANLAACFTLFFESTFLARCLERKRSQRRAQTSHKMLQHMTSQLNTMLNSQKLMIANISHEMRTSLNAIVGYIRILNLGEVSIEQSRSYLHKAHEASEVLLRLVGDVLDVTKINAGELDVKPMEFWVDALMINAINAVEPFMRKKPKVVFSYDVDFFPLPLYGDRERVLSVVTNLLTNAFKYTESGTVTFSVKKGEAKEAKVPLLFCVEDTGVGMTPAQIENVFTPFSRFSKSQEGVGLGLFIARKLARKMGGDLQVYSTPGEGSRFEFSLVLSERTRSVEVADATEFWFLNGRLPEGSSVFDATAAYFEQMGVQIRPFFEQKDFVGSLLDETISVPEMVTVYVAGTDYLKYDALIGYLKQEPRFEKTYFAACCVIGDLPLVHFDFVSSDLIPMELYYKQLDVVSGRATTGTHEERTLRVLCVDDIETNLEVLKLHIQNRFPAAVVHLAGGGYEAVGMYKTHVYDLVLIDLKMPGMSGFDLVRKLSGIHPLPPTYALSADVYDDTHKKVLKAGFKGLLEKPLQPDTLYKTIEKALDEHHS